LKTETETRFNCETKISLVCSTSYLRTRAGFTDCPQQLTTTVSLTIDE